MHVTADAYATDRGELLCPSCASERRAEIEDGVIEGELWAAIPADERWPDDVPGPIEVLCSECGEELA